ncbi:RNA-directed DNA polymerase from mobile element jockey [Anabarilius grahami]|uniref:RNA-directed DNA polymerase from mobile element jockey n=1 Tax=Anabarilius grahami TaxID=495550 RepID=A0A3N0XTN3_ANAGA|nr:RNA-directed DNA polymerase from mobile element jockey [Anabarilius grahami]
MAAVNIAPNACKYIQVAGSSPTSLPNDLNSFYTRFEADNSTQLETIISTLKPGDSALTISTEEVVRALKKTKVKSAPGLDNICGRTLKYCAEQLGGVLQTLFQNSLVSGVVPQKWKHSTVIPIPKRSSVKAFNNLRPVALTSLVMKAMERIIKNFITKITDPQLDPLQFAYRTGRGVDDAKVFITDVVHEHLESPNTTARLLFVDFSSAFNTLQPHILAEKLSSRFHLEDQLIRWIIDFMTNRSQRVLVNNTLSDLLYTYTGSPQGCVLSPLLFILYTDDCRSTHPNCHLIKFADDTVLLSLLSGSSQQHGPALHEFVEWCDNSCLELNVKKTKEMVVTFSNKQRQMAMAVTTVIHGNPIEIVEEYKYLGTIFDNLLKFTSNTEEILRKCQQR